jgi:hypothetical protein
VSTRYLQSVEAGVENLTIDSLAKFANVLDVKMVRLFDKPNTPPRRRQTASTG